MSYIMPGGLGRTWAMVALRDDGDDGHPTQYQSATPSTHASAMIMAMKQMAMMNDMYVHIALGRTCRALHQQLQMGLTLARNLSSAVLSYPDGMCMACTDFGLASCSPRQKKCQCCGQNVCEYCVALTNPWICERCSERIEIPGCQSMRCWLTQQLWEQLIPTYEIYKDFDFSFQLITLSGNLVMDRSQPDKQVAVLIHTVWDASNLGTVWNKINYHS